MDEDPRNREMLLSALQFYSDHCYPDQLHPGCPFSEPTPSGLGCADQCMDYLGDHRNNVKSTAQQILPGIEAYPIANRRKHRRGPEASDPPFDAMQVYLESRGEPIDKQSPVALLKGLQELLCDLSADGDSEEHSRYQQAERIRATLLARDFDADSIIRGAIIPLMAQALCFRSILHAVVDEELSWRANGQRWFGILLRGQEEHSGDNISQAIISRILLEDVWRVCRWLKSLTLEQMADWEPPKLDQFVELSADPILNPESLSTWAFDRFTETYLANWQTSSLHLEWEYLHGRRPGICLHRQMSTRRLTKEELAATIADRASGSRSSGSLQIISKCTEDAVKLLTGGNRQAAVAVFDVACALAPTSPDAFNNRGFCKLPDDPDAALGDFETARNLGPSDPFVTAANQMLALYRTGKAAAALKVGEDAWDWDHQISSEAYLWDTEATEPTLVFLSSIKYLVNLAAHISRGSGYATEEAKWKHRAQQLDEK